MGVEIEKPEYLGDGVYVKFDGYHVVLMANDHRTPSDTIYLDSHVMHCLEQFFERLKQKE